MKTGRFILVLSLLSLMFYSGCESNDAVTNSVYIPQPVNKKVLVEFFTNSYCLPCVNTHHYWDQVEGILGTTLNDTSIILISVHARSPSQNDSLYRANIVQSDARFNYYGVQLTGTPNCQIDGTYMGQFSSSNYTQMINDEFKTPRYLDVGLANNFNGADSGTVTVTLKALSNLPTSDNVIHVVITENNVSYVTAPNHVTSPSDVMRYMCTGSDGMSITLPQGQNVTFSQNYGIANNWKLEDCYITVYVQSISTKQIYGVERIKVLK